MNDRRNDLPIMNLPPPSDGQVIAELSRELATRETVYPVWIYQKRLKPHEADHRKACIRKALHDLRELYAGADGGR